MAVPEPTATPAAFVAYARRATAGIDSRTERTQAREEIVGHLLDLHDDEIAAGATGDEAVARALVRMGEADSIARPIEDAHTPRWRVGVVVTIVLAGAAVAFLLWLALYLTYLSMSS